MAILQAADIADLITTTQAELGRLRFTTIAMDLQEYVAMNQLLRSNRVEFDSGQAVQWNLMVATSGAAKDTGLFAVDSVNVGDVMKTASVPWRHVTSNYAIERRELAINRNPAKIVDLVTTRRIDAMSDLIEHMEEKFWARPPSSTVGDGIYGVPYWMTWTSGSAGAFDGGNLSDFSDGPGGLSATTYPNWKNWSADYANITKQDLVRKLRKAATFTKFRPPVPNANYEKGMDKYGYYTNYSVIGPMEEILESQNDNLGNDVASKDGQVLFRRTPMTWVPHLEGRTGNPVYGINWSVFHPVFLQGEYLREEGPMRAANQHTVFQTHIDLTMNIRCVDRRRLFVMATDDPDTTVA